VNLTVVRLVGVFVFVFVFVFVNVCVTHGEVIFGPRGHWGPRSAGGAWLATVDRQTQIRE